jgi:hypothetical protein
LEESNGQVMNITEMLEFIPGQQLYIESLQPFKKNHNYTLKLRFTYRLSTELEGFYISSYTTPDGDKRYVFFLNLKCKKHAKNTYKFTGFSQRRISRQPTPEQHSLVSTSRTSRRALNSQYSGIASTSR